MSEMAGIEAGMADPTRHGPSLIEFKDRLADLAHKAESPTDSADRRLARRVLRGTLMNARELSGDAEVRKVIEKYRIWRGQNEQR